MPMIFPIINADRIPSDLTTIVFEFTVSHGENLVAGGYPHPQTWSTETEAAEAMSRMCWHPKRFVGPFRVVPVTVTRTKYGTVLAVSA